MARGQRDPFAARVPTADPFVDHHVAVIVSIITDLVGRLAAVPLERAHHGAPLSTDQNPLTTLRVGDTEVTQPEGLVHATVAIVVDAITTLGLGAARRALGAHATAHTAHGITLEQTVPTPAGRLADLAHPKPLVNAPITVVVPLVTALVGGAVV